MRPYVCESPSILTQPLPTKLDPFLPIAGRAQTFHSFLNLERFYEIISTLFLGVQPSRPFPGSVPFQRRDCQVGTEQPNFVPSIFSLPSFIRGYAMRHSYAGEEIMLISSDVHLIVHLNPSTPLGIIFDSRTSRRSLVNKQTIRDLNDRAFKGPILSPSPPHTLLPNNGRFKYDPK